MATVVGFDLGEKYIVGAKWKTDANGSEIGSADVLYNDFRRRMIPFDMEFIY